MLARHGLRKKWFPADLVVLAAGGLGTPLVLQNSGIACEAKLFVDPVLCVAAEMEDSFQNRELPMPFAVQKKGYIISPYFDHLSFFFNRDWRRKAGNIYSLMIKLADDNQGSVSRGRVEKTLTADDRKSLEEAAATCAEMFQRAGVDKSRLFFGTVNAGHPGRHAAPDRRAGPKLPRSPAAGKPFCGRCQPVSRLIGQSSHSDHHGHGQAHRQNMPAQQRVMRPPPLPLKQCGYFSVQNGVSSFDLKFFPFL